MTTRTKQDGDVIVVWFGHGLRCHRVRLRVSVDHRVVVGARDRAKGKRIDETLEGQSRRREIRFFIFFLIEEIMKRELFFFWFIRSKGKPKKLVKCWLQNNFSAIVVIFAFPLNEILS